MRAWIALLAVLLLFGCADGGQSPTPTAPTQRIRSYQGVWQGAWLRQSCSENGASGAACASLPTTGSLRLTISQAGANVTGTLELGSYVVAVSGVVGVDGALSLAGQGNAGGVTVSVTNWRTSAAATSMGGTFTYSLVTPGFQFGSATVNAGLQNVTKTS